MLGSLLVFVVLETNLSAKAQGGWTLVNTIQLTGTIT